MSEETTEAVKPKRKYVRKVVEKKPEPVVVFEPCDACRSRPICIMKKWCKKGN